MTAIEATQLSPRSLTAFEALVRERLGLAIGRAPDLVARKLWSTALGAGLVAVNREAWVTTLGNAPLHSRCWSALADIVPNHETSFFRDVDQLQHAVEKLPCGTTEVRMLSVGCSSGEEVYSLAMLLHGQLDALWGRRAEVWGVDVSPAALARARRGFISSSAVNRAGAGPEGWRTRFLRAAADGFMVRDHIRERTRFHEANLAMPATLAVVGQFDVVLCRNVLIHFEQTAAVNAVKVLRALVKPGGTLILGAAEAPLLGGER